MDWTSEKINEIMGKIGARSKTDRDFRDELINNPKKTIEDISGIKLPEDFELSFVEQKPNKMILPLPPFEGDELNDSDLEAVAGGKGAPTISGIAASISDAGNKLKPPGAPSIAGL